MANPSPVESSGDGLQERGLVMTRLGVNSRLNIPKPSQLRV